MMEKSLKNHLICKLQTITRVGHSRAFHTTLSYQLLSSSVVKLTHLSAIRRGEDES